MKYNRLEKHKITYLKDTISYNKITYKPKSNLLKELESQIKYRLNFSTSNRTNYLTCTKIDISEIFTI
jgi:hypothetical protein